MYVPLDRHSISLEARKYHNGTYSYIESFEPIAGSRTKRKNLGTGVRDTDLKITVSVFLF
jgi:hypothetical protein